MQGMFKNFQKQSTELFGIFLGVKNKLLYRQRSLTDRGSFFCAVVNCVDMLQRFSAQYSLLETLANNFNFLGWFLNQGGLPFAILIFFIHLWNKKSVPGQKRKKWIRRMKSASHPADNAVTNCGRTRGRSTRNPSLGCLSESFHRNSESFLVIPKGWNIQVGVGT